MTMITPTKHMKLETSVLRVSALIAKEISKRRVQNVETLRKKLLKKLGPDVDMTFLPALNFLFLLGKIKYYPKNDTLEFVDG